MAKASKKTAKAKAKKKARPPAVTLEHAKAKVGAALDRARK